MNKTEFTQALRESQISSLTNEIVTRLQKEIITKHRDQVWYVKIAGIPADHAFVERWYATLNRTLPEPREGFDFCGTTEETSPGTLVFFFGAYDVEEESDVDIFHFVREDARLASPHVYVSEPTVGWVEYRDVVPDDEEDL